MKQFFVWSVVTLFLVMMESGKAQFPDLKIKLPKRIPGLNKILQSKPPITTSIADAITEVPFLDNFEPETAWPMTVLPRTSDGGFMLEHPGNYMFECKSYCLRAGTYAPGEERGGRGYLYAPLKGPQADIVTNILKKSFRNPEIPQKDIQLLLWAVISRTKIKDMSPKMKHTAAKLLSAKEIFRINGGALGLIPRKLLTRAFDNLPSPVQRVMEAEARLRIMLTKTQASYEEIERIAVLQGEPPPEEGDREIPLGRWSFHPDGYFLRYFPHGYTRMLIELYYPEPFQIKRDTLGRLISITDQSGNSLETSYSDSTETLSIPEDVSFKGYPIQSLRLLKLNPRIKKPETSLRREWINPGWAFTGIPDVRVKMSSLTGLHPDLKEHYRFALVHKRELDHLYQGLKKLGRLDAGPGLRPDQKAEIMSLGHFAITVQKAMEDNDPKTNNQTINPLKLVKKAWLFAVAKHLNTCQRIPEFNPADDPVPGQGGSQRGGDSGCESDKGKTCDQKYTECKNKSESKLKQCIEDALKNHATPGCSCEEWNFIYKCLSRATTADDRYDCLARVCNFYECETDKYFFDLLETCLLEYAIDKRDCLREHVNCHD